MYYTVVDSRVFDENYYGSMQYRLQTHRRDAYVEYQCH